MNRRRFLTATAALGAGALLPGWTPAPAARWETTHPRLFVTARPTGTLRSVDDLRRAIRGGHAGALWERLRAAARADADALPLTPADPLPGRLPSALRDGNPDFIICEAAGLRMLRAALVHLVEGDARLKAAALRQVDAVLDPDVWPDWIDQAHLRFGHPAGLRTGMLARDVGLAYDWLHPYLTDEERRRIVEGLDRRAIRPFFTSLAQNPWWVHDLNNWVTTIAGGLSVAALALGDAHPESEAVVAASRPYMDAYLERYGPEGEYNECPAYANATQRPVTFYAALRYATGGTESRIARHPFPATCYWTMYLTLPPGRIAALGDSKPEMRPWIRHVAAVAAATQDGLLQRLYLDQAAGREQADPLELLWYDDRLAPVDPAGRLPLGRAYAAQGACFSSRTSWSPRSAACVVYGKASREENHEHNDDGQVCIDGYGERLIVDLGPPSAYPADFFDEGRWRYYNASVRGHNVLQIGGRERRVFERQRGEPFDERWEAIRGRLVAAAFDDARGGSWQADLTPAYDGVRRVRRALVHLLPGIVAVLDEAELVRPEEIALRWHTIDRCRPDADGAFVVRGREARLVGRIVGLGGERLAFGRGEHAYEAPYDRTRGGDPLEPRRESYVEARLTGERCRLLTLFAVVPPGADLPAWTAGPGGYRLEGAPGPVVVNVEDGLMRVGDGEKTVEAILEG